MTSPLDPKLYSTFNADHVALHHEIGHAGVWFLFGEGLGPLRLCRAHDGLLEPSILAKAADVEQTPTPAYVEMEPEKLLAGEIAARRCLGMATDRVSIGDARVAQAHAGWSPLAVAGMCRTGNAQPGAPMEDIVKVLCLAHQHHRLNWWTWVQDRLRRANDLVQTCWPTIDVVCRRLAKRVPRRAGVQQVVWGTDLIAWMSEAGLSPLGRPPTELVPQAHPGPCMVRARRSLRSSTGRPTPTRSVPWRLERLGAE